MAHYQVETPQKKKLQRNISPAKPHVLKCSVCTGFSGLIASQDAELKWHGISYFKNKHEDMKLIHILRI